jgi:hypothetical protein
LKATEHDEGEIEVDVGEAKMITKNCTPKQHQPACPVKVAALTQTATLAVTEADTQNPLLIGEHDDEATLIERGVKLLNHLAEQANRGESVGVGYAQFVCCVHGVKSFEEVTKHPYTRADTANVLDLAHRITREAGRKPVAKNGVKLKAGMDTFIWRAKPNHPRPSKAFESTPYTGFGLRLMSSLNDVIGIPTEGKDLIIVAAVNNVLYFRVFDGDGKVVVDTDEKRLTGQARQIEGLREQLERLWPPHELTTSDKGRVVTAYAELEWKTAFPDGTRRLLDGCDL